ncbi:MAG: DUF5107 domain-containing protein [Butyrivibrio sp.]|nr:DUF5107 domain-containing protein [Butyrivibrio sp.]
MERVKIWEESVLIPTYDIGEADKNPMFLEKRVYQGSSGKIYPYPATQKISRKKEDKEWRAVFLENEYLKVMVLPELGGRIQRAYDKTNGYDFVYYNKVIKPALVGLAGPWISGGIEFNWPQHHRPTTYMKVDYRLRENEDGSKSLLLGDVDRMYGTKVITSITLYPGKAYIEIGGQLYNRTPLPQTFLWWANPAVSVNDNTQSVFPPDVHSVYDHGKRAVSRFPIATGEYYKHDYSEGVDISRYRNIPVPTSYMAEKSDYDFVGGYDYGVEAGLLHVADHHISPGKKQWTWGCGDFGKAWDRNLTDEDGPYIELMTGVYCDNQPDFTWLKPFEEKSFKQYFMPYKKVGMVKNATIHGAVNLEVEADSISAKVYTTEEYKNARVEIFDGKDKIYDETTDISPTKVCEISIPAANPDEYRIKLIVSHEGKELVSYMPKDQGIPALAEPAQAAKLPKDIMTNEELFLTGQHIEQYRHATYLPDQYYLEGLKRDDGDTRINNAYGMLLLRRGRIKESEGYFRKAIERLTKLNPNPYDSEAYYNLGLSLFYQERFDEAFDAFYKATWSNEQQEMAFYYLAVIESRRGEYGSALDLVERGLIKNSHSIKARGLKTQLLRKLGRTKEMNTWAAESILLDPFDFVSRQEAEGDIENYLQAARDFSEAGFYDDALKILDSCGMDKPIMHYYRAFYYDKLQMSEDAKKELKLAESCDPTYTFPNKLEDLQVLEKAIGLNPDGAKAYYYLGCLHYDKLGFERAIELWDKSAELDNRFPTLLRNLSIAYYNKKGDPEKAREYLERAFELDRSDARVFLELDQLYQRLGMPDEFRLARYEENISLIDERDDLYTEYVTLLNLSGQYEKAYEMIVSHNFRTWEGAEGKITAQFKLCLYAVAKKALGEGNAVLAKEKVLEALSYPENLGEGKLEGTKDNNLYYLLAEIAESLSDKELMKDSLERAVLGVSEPAGMMYYYDQPADMILYQGLAYEKLGKKAEANRRFYKLIDYGEHHLRDKFVMDYFAVSMPDMSVFDNDMDKKNETFCYYLMGLGNIGLGRRPEAKKWFKKALDIENTHQLSRFYASII